MVFINKITITATRFGSQKATFRLYKITHRVCTFFCLYPDLFYDRLSYTFEV